MLLAFTNFAFAKIMKVGVTSKRITHFLRKGP